MAYKAKIGKGDSVISKGRFGIRLDKVVGFVSSHKAGGTDKAEA
jgi:hypothetical protein